MGRSLALSLVATDFDGIERRFDGALRFAEDGHEIRFTDLDDGAVFADHFTMDSVVIAVLSAKLQAWLGGRLFDGYTAEEKEDV